MLRWFWIVLVRLWWTIHLGLIFVALTSLLRVESAFSQTLSDAVSLSDIQAAVGPNAVSVAQQLDGTIWLGTEGGGVFRYDEKAQPGQQLTQYSTKDGSLADDMVYALCADKKNRVWAGHLSHGVSVFDGYKWKNYDVLDGPIGERIYSIACCPKDGSVWMATSAGLTRYNPNTDQWQNYTQEDGLPEDQATSLAFDPETGDLLVGFKTKGLGIARFSEGYSQWSGPPYFVGQSKTDHGTGLPSGMINDVLITKSRIYCAATTQGLAWSLDRGQNWKFQRGENWADKVQLLRAPLPGFSYMLGSEKALIPEDAVTSLAELPDGNLALGFWNKGLSGFNLISETSAPIHLPKINYRTPDDIVKLATLQDGRLLLLAYGSGFYVDPPFQGTPADQMATAAVPPPAQPMESRDIIALRARLENDLQASVDPNSPVAFLGEDWRTGGDYLGRYGRFWTCLCGVGSQSGDFIWGSGDQPVSYVVGRSRQHRADDTWCSWENDHVSPRSLEMPFPVQPADKTLTAVSNRLQGEWNDGGQNRYIRDYDGPHLRCNLKIPSGLYVLSYYTINENGQSGPNRFRDYRVMLREHEGDFNDVESDFKKGALSVTRTMSFYGGCYTRWLVRGPTDLTLEINRNFSFNAKISGLMLDSVDELPPPYLESWQDYHDPAKHALFQSAHTAQSENAPDVVARALDCLDLLEVLEYKNPSRFALVQRKAYLEIGRYLRIGLPAQEPNLVKGYRECLFHLGLFEEWEKRVVAEFGKSPRSIEKSIHLPDEARGNGNGRLFVEQAADLTPKR